MIVVIGVVGYSGRMGRAIAKVVDAHPTACLAGGISRGRDSVCAEKGCPHIITDNPQELFPQCDVIVDFSHATATPVFARLAAEAGKAFLTGTTNLDPETMDVLRHCAEKIPVLHTANTSISLAVTRAITKMAARMLKDYDFDIAILDKHHRWKKDLPSGTALALGEAVKGGNDGSVLPSYASMRTGAIVGEHEVIFAGPGEVITVHHSVTDRRVFARGAVHAAVWLAAQKPGFYTMDDVLGNDGTPSAA